MEPFKKYETDLPLIYLHLYKCAGSSVKSIFSSWFADSINKEIVWNYRNENNITCTDDTINLLSSTGIQNPLFFGHFGVEDDSYKFPSSCKQFMTMLRHPFDQVVSSYFYDRQQGDDSDSIELNIEEYIIKRGTVDSFVDEFNKERLDIHNYKEVISKYFVYIGVVEQFEDSIIKMSKILKKETTPIDLKTKVNRSIYTQKIPRNLICWHREKFKLDYMIYDYVKTINTQ